MLGGTCARAKEARIPTGLKGRKHGHGSNTFDRLPTRNDRHSTLHLIRTGSFLARHRWCDKYARERLQNSILGITQTPTPYPSAQRRRFACQEVSSCSETILCLPAKSSRFFL